MKHYILFIIVSISLFSCKIKSKESLEIQNSDLGLTKVEETKQILEIDFDKESIYDVVINGKTWEEIELGGRPDTALTLYAYRIIFTNEKDDFIDCEIRTNLIEESQKVKEIFPTIFHKKSQEIDFNNLLDSLNEASYEYATEFVKQDLEQYGKSDGPCFELYNLIKNSKK